MIFYFRTGEKKRRICGIWMKKIWGSHTALLLMDWHDGRKKPEFTSLTCVVWRFECLLKKKKKALLFCHGLLSFCPIQIVPLFYKANRADLLDFVGTLLRTASLHVGVFLFFGLTNFNQREDAIAFIRWNFLNPPLKNPHVSWYVVSLPSCAHSSCCVCLSVPCSTEILSL